MKQVGFLFTVNLIGIVEHETRTDQDQIRVDINKLFASPNAKRHAAKALRDYAHTLEQEATGLILPGLPGGPSLAS